MSQKKKKDLLILSLYEERKDIFLLLGNYFRLQDFTTSDTYFFPNLSEPSSYLGTFCIKKRKKIKGKQRIQRSHEVHLLQ